MSRELQNKENDAYNDSDPATRSEGQPIPRLDAFIGKEGNTFTLIRDAGDDIELTLTEIGRSNDHHRNREQFSLLFDGPSAESLDQGAHRLSHPELDPFDVMLVPVVSDEPDPTAVSYEAVVNRNVPGQEPVVMAEGITPSRRGVLGSMMGLVIGGGILSLFGSERASATPFEPLIGGMSMFAGNFAPRGWAFCHGQLLSISQNTALFSILGTTYGGDGRTTFALPDLRGRVPIGAGQGPGLAQRRVGETGGSEAVTLEVDQMPSHTHPSTAGPIGQDLHLPVTSSNGDTKNPAGNILAARGSRENGRGRGRGPDEPIYSTGSADGEMAIAGDISGDLQVGNSGANQAHDNVPPYQVINYIIALHGIFPPRN